MQLIPVRIPEFIATFVDHLRIHPRVLTKPSLRQGIAIIEFLSARYFRHHTLCVQDLIQAAVSTSYYEEQSIAREIALEILQKLLNDRIVDEYQQPVSIQRLTEVIRVNTALQKYIKDEKVLEELFKVDLTHMEDLRELADIIYKSKKDHLEPDDFKYLNATQKLEQFESEMTGRDKLYAESLLQEEGWKDKLAELFHQNQQQFTQAMRDLRDLGVEQSKLEPVLQKAAQELRDLDQYERLLRESQLYAPPHPDLLNQIPTTEAHNALKTAQELDKEFYAHKANITDQMLQNFVNRKLELSLKEILESYTDTEFWRKIAEQYLNQQRNTRGAEQNLQLSRHLRNEIPKFPSLEYQSFIRQQSKTSATQALNQTTTADQFQDMASTFQQEGQPFDKNQAQVKAQSLGMTPDQFEPLLQSPLEQIRQMINQNIDDFEKYAQKIEDLNLNSKTVSELLREAHKHQLTALPGALGLKNLRVTTEIWQKSGYEHDVNYLMQGLARGSGLNLLLQWFHHKDNIPTPIKSQLERLVQTTLLNLGRFYVKNYFGFLSHGQILETNEIRNFIEGDTLDSLDLEETVLNLINQGKNPDIMTENDIICRRFKQGRVKIVIVVDTSGSMYGEKMTMASLASVILLQILSQQEISILVFAGDTRIMKDFDTVIDMSQLAAELLNLKATGGTQVEKTVEYLNEQVHRLDPGQLLLCFLFSDFGFYEQERELEPLLQKMGLSNLRLFAISREPLDEKMVKLFARYIHLHQIQIRKVEALPQIIARLLLEIH